MEKEKMQLSIEAMSAANSLDYVLTQLGMEKETEEKIEEWAKEMSWDQNKESHCNILLLANKLTNKTKKHFPNQYNVKFYTNLEGTVEYNKLVDVTLEKIDESKRKKKADQIHKLNAIHKSCSLEELKEGDIGIGGFVKVPALPLGQVIDSLKYVIELCNQKKTAQINHYMMIKKTKDGIFVYDPLCHDHKPYRLSNYQVITNMHYSFSGAAMIVSKEGE